MLAKALALGLAGLAGLAAAAAAQEPGPVGRIAANGLEMGFERRGEGSPPLVILHGAFMTGGMMAPLAEALAEGRETIVLDLQGHGRTADADRPLTYGGMAEDVAAATEALGVERADVFGFSMGGAVALRLAIDRPDRVRRLVVAGASMRGDGVYPEMLAMMEGLTPEMLAATPFAEAYRAVAPDPEGFPALVAKVKALEAEPPDWSAEVAAMAAPMLIMAGDADIVRPEHVAEMWRARGGGPSPDFLSAPGSELAILPGTPHLGVIERVEWTAPMIDAFLDKPIDRPARAPRTAPTAPPAAGPSSP